MIVSALVGSVLGICYFFFSSWKEMLNGWKSLGFVRPKTAVEKQRAKKYYGGGFFKISVKKTDAKWLILLFVAGVVLSFLGFHYPEVLLISFITSWLISMVITVMVMDKRIRDNKIR